MCKKNVNLISALLFFVLVSASIFGDTFQDTSTSDFSSGTVTNTQVINDSVQMSTQSGWWNPAANWWSGGALWPYRKAFTLNNAGSSTLSDYQVKIENPVYNDAGLAGSWHFEETSGTVSGTVADTSGNGNYGTLTNITGPNGIVAGNTGNAISLDGSADYVSIGNPVPASLQIQNELSLEAWIYATAYPGSSTLSVIVGCQRDTNTAGYAIHLDGRTNPDGQTSPAGHIHFQMGNGTYYTTNANAQVPLNQWVHVAATRKANEAAKVYYNGVLQPSTSISGWNGSLTYTNAELAIGRQSDYANRYFGGTIDEVRIYSRALSAEEIKAHYTAKAKLNYGDVRFTNSSGTELPYWFEKDGTFWVKAAGSNSIPVGLSAIYMYYGNTSAASGGTYANNGTNTFDFYDDFESYSVGGNGSPTWSISAGNWTVQSIAGSKAYRTDSSNQWVDAYTAASGTSFTNFSLRAKIRYSGATKPYDLGFVNSGYFYTYGSWAGSDGLKSPTNGSWLTSDVLSADTWYTLRLDKNASTLSHYLNNVWKFNSTNAVSPVSLQLYYNYAYAYIDEVRVSKLASPEPVVSPGSEVSQSSLWLYRKPLTVNNLDSSALSNHQIKISNPVYDETGLMGSWHFDLGTSGNIPNSSTAGLQDMSGNTNNGTASNVNGSGMAWVIGKFNSGVQFDGIDDDIVVPSSSSLNFAGKTQQTITAWFKRGAITDLNGRIITTENLSYTLYIEPAGAISFYGKNSAGTVALSMSGGASVVDEWVFVTVKVDGQNAYLYKNGAQIAVINDTNFDSFYNDTSQIHIGNYTSATPRHFNGIIDEVRIYNRALSDTEISSLYAAKAKLNYGDMRFTNSSGYELPYWMEKDGTFWVKILGSNSLVVGNNTLYGYYGNSGISGASNLDAVFVKDFSDTGLLGLWHLDETEGLTASDSSSAGKNGTLNNFTNAWYPVDGGQWANRSDARFSSGSCLNFDGSNDNVSIGNLGSFPAQGAVEFWMNASEMANYRNPFTTKYNGGNAGIRFEENSAGNFVVGTGNDSGTFDAATYFASGMQINTWYHIVYVWNTTTNMETGYLNGVQVFSNSHTLWPTTIPDLRLGTGYDTTAARQWKGLLDEVRVYNRTITANEAKAHYERRKTSNMTTALQPGPEGKDAYVRINDDWDGYSNTVNHGSETSLEFRLFGVDNYDRRIFIKFDNLPSSPVNNAQLKMYMWDNGSSNFGTRTIVVRKTTSTWDESTVTAAAQPAYGTSDYASISVSSLGWYTWDITSLVNEWISSPSTDYGLMMRVTTPTGNWYSANFYSSDYSADTSLRPKLELSVEPYSATSGSEQNSYSPSGSFASSIKDTTANDSTIKSVSWTTAGNGTITMQARANNSNTGWTDSNPSWEAVTNGDTSIAATGRYVQYKATFTGSGASADPALTDVTIAYNCLPSIPLNSSPADAVQISTLTPVLEASAFSDPNAGNTHSASRWQMTAIASDYSAPVYDSNETAIDLTATTLSSGTVNDDGTLYYWHVSYKDSEGDWSAYSAETSFSIIPPELVSAFVVDTDYDDKADTLQVYVSEDILGNTASVTTGLGFALTGSGYVYTISSGTEISAGIIKFSLDEKTNADLSSTFTIDYSSIIGDLVDVDGLASKVATVNSLSVSINALKVTELAYTDTNNNGKLDVLTLTFNNDLTGAGDVSDWQVTDADGATNLLAGLTNSSVSYSQNKIYITLSDLTGTTGIPVILYNPDGLNTISDTNGFSLYSFSTLYDTTAPLAPQAVLPANASSFESQSVAFTWTTVTDLSGVSYSIEIDDSDLFNIPLIDSAGGLTTAGTTALLSPGTYYWHVKAIDGNNNASAWSSLFSFTITTSTIPESGGGDTGGDDTGGGGTGNDLPTDDALTADAGPDQVKEPSVIYLDGSASTDANGANNGLSYEWTLLSSPYSVTPQLLNPLTSSPYFIASTAGDYVFQLVIFTQTAMSNPDTVTITITDIGPFADAGADRTYANGPVITLDGSKSKDPNEDVLTYSWVQISGAEVLIENSDTANAGFSSLNTVGTLKFRLTVADTAGNSSEDTVYITLNSTTDTVPVADAGVTQTTSINSTVQLNGAFSIDAESQTLSYYWAQASGPADAVLINANTASAEFTPEVSGVYTFELIVSDGASESMPGTVTVMVNGSSNNLPMAIAKILFPSGGTPVCGEQVILTAGESTDSDGDALIYQWEQVYGPSIAVSETNTQYLIFTPALAGNYKFRLSVSDGKVNAGIDDEIEIVVMPYQDYAAPNAVIELDSTLDPDGDLRIFSSSSTVTLDGSQSTGEGALEYLWTQTQGPSLILNGDNEIEASFQVKIPYTYGFRLAVIDENGLQDYEDFFVVIDTDTNGVPEASAGENITGNIGSAIHLDASGSSDPEWDPDGFTGSADLTFIWEQTAGAPVILYNADTAYPYFISYVSGEYKFKVYVSDGASISPADEITATITGTTMTTDIADAGTADTIDTENTGANPDSGTESGSSLDELLDSQQGTRTKGCFIKRLKIGRLKD